MVTSDPPVQIPPGTVVPWLGGAGQTPRGWLRCDGTNVSRTTYAALFAAVGTMYGAGDGTTTFGLPGGAERLPVGANALTPGTSGSAHPASNSSHQHTLSMTPSATMGYSATNTNHGHNVAAPVQNATSWSHGHSPAVRATGGPSANFVGFSGNANLLATDNHTHSFGNTNFANDAGHTHGTNNPTVGTSNQHSHNASTYTLPATGPSASHQPPHVALWHLIKT